MTESNAVPGFLPSRHGLHFANRWEPGPTIRLGVLDPRVIGIGDARAGLCGGMTLFVRERFEAGRSIPPETVPPANGSPLFRAIVRHQVLSLDWLRVPLRFWRAAAMRPKALALRTLDIEWPKIRDAIDRGRLPVVGLVRHHGWNPFQLDRDHQVLAFGYEVDGGPASVGGPADANDLGSGITRPPITLRLYDPNWPDRDDVTISLTPTGMRQSTGERLLGLLALS
ncbi:MAG: hypothetical protein OEV61_04840 [Chloroflexota bacterium]|jgi:hypothetical protein|nr:hypothetical protein [Chloroflexota bacterium]MDH5244307.1 hypothetical protein [Chloroflexota bacterium]